MLIETPNASGQVATRILGFLFSLGPILFGLGFLAPVIAALIDVAGMAPPFGLRPIEVGLLLGGGLGLIARQRRTWLW